MAHRVHDVYAMVDLGSTLRIDLKNALMLDERILHAKREYTDAELVFLATNAIIDGDRAHYVLTHASEVIKCILHTATYSYLNLNMKAEIPDLKVVASKIDDYFKERKENALLSYLLATNASSTPTLAYDYSEEITQDIIPRDSSSSSTDLSNHISEDFVDTVGMVKTPASVDLKKMEQIATSMRETDIIVHLVPGTNIVDRRARPMSCNRHADCFDAEAKDYAKYKKQIGANFHCWDDDCEDCFGK